MQLVSAAYKMTGSVARAIARPNVGTDIGCAQI
jgi:hypothetical protein